MFSEFRASVEKAFPAASALISRIPSTDPASPSVATDASAAVGSVGEKGTSTLPPGYDTVPNLLRKIEESKVTLPTADSASEVKRSEPKERAETNLSQKNRTSIKPVAAKATTANPVQISTPDETVGDGPIHVQQKDDPKEKKASPVGNALRIPVEKEPTLSERMTASDSEEKKPNASAGTTASATSGKEKLARILGKGNFQADKVDGSDVVDDSVYMKPKAWSSSSAPSRAKLDAKRHESRPVSPEVAPKAKFENTTEANAEVMALRSELQSQMKWEAVRLQEAVRAQMVEDKKLAAKEAAAVAKKHAEELAQVREDAVLKARQMLAERTQEMKVRTEAERDADVLRLLKVKEDELREAITADLADKERVATMERKKALIDAKAHVTALSEQFEGVVWQTGKAKEAAKRASCAFMLRETVSTCRPIGKELSEASSKTQLGQLVVDSVPEKAVHAGVETLDMLQDKFERASKQGLSVAMVPDGSAGTIWGHWLGAIFSRLKIPVDSRDDDPDSVPTTNEERIRLARRLVAEGDLGSAILTLDQLSGLSADVMSDWLRAAKARIAVDLAAEVLLADAIISQMALTGGQS